MIKINSNHKLKSFIMSDEYKGQIRRCRIRKVYRPKRDLYVVVGIIRGDENQEAQFFQVEFLKPFDEGVPVPETIVCDSCPKALLCNNS